MYVETLAGSLEVLIGYFVIVPLFVHLVSTDTVLKDVCLFQELIPYDSYSMSHANHLGPQKSLDDQ